MRVLVTGAGGFLGHYVVAELADQGINPIPFDRRAVPEWARYEAHLGDVRDRTAVEASMAVVDGWIHLAGLLGTQETVDDPLPALETNIVGSVNVFQAARRYGRPGVNISVGNYWMANPYSISKRAAETAARMFNREHGTQIATVRALNAYGPHQKAEPVRKIVPNLIGPALEGRPIRIYGDGEQVMDMIYAADVARILVAALTEDHGEFERPFEAGTGRRTTVNEIAQIVLEVAAEQGGPPGSLEHVPMRPGEEPGAVVVGDPETLRPLGIDPGSLVALEDGIRRTLRAHQPIGVLDTAGAGG